MTNPNVRGRHRAPGRHHPLTELKAIARESAQPAMKGAAVVAAAGGLVATFATPAGADTLTAVDTNVAVAAPAAPAVVGPAAATSDTATDLASFGFAAPTAAKAKAAKPQVIEDVIVKAQRAEAARVIAAKAAADAKAKAAARSAAKARAADRARTAAKAATSQRESSSQRSSRSTTRRTLTNSTSATKASSNSYTPQASSGSRSGRNWATPGQCTWGALAQWYASEGYYPSGWTGNALVWGSGAARSGYTVSSTPRARSILVMQPGVHGSSSYAGHVAWVTSVSGSSVTVIEMNALAGAYRYNTRTLTNMGGMRYIYAP